MKRRKALSTKEKEAEIIDLAMAFFFFFFLMTWLSLRSLAQ